MIKAEKANINKQKLAILSNNNTYDNGYIYLKYIETSAKLY